jgi:starvation-inducible outer membrane lipoprotein
MLTFVSLKTFLILSIYFSQVHTMAMHIKLWHLHCNVQILKNLTPWRDSNPGSLCSVGGCDDHYATPPGLLL